MASESALLRLASVAPRDLVRAATSGRRLLHDILLDCRAAGLTTAPAGDNDVALLHALFDVALRNGLGSVVYDYVVEVCSDNDALEAYLMDGDCVKSWCTAALEREQGHLLQGLARGLPSLAALGDLHRHVGRLAALVTVLEALAEPQQGAAGGAAGADAGSTLPLALARQLHQCVQVLEWAAQHVAAHAAPGRFASDAEWRTAVNKRRDAAAPAPTFLQDLLQALAQEGTPQLPYPPASLERAVQSIFLAGRADAMAWRAKLALWLYYLLDAGHAVDPQAFMTGFAVPPRLLVEWRAYWQLDDALLGNAAALEEACRTLPAAATPQMSFRVVQALAGLGCGGVALDVLRARSGAAGGADEQDSAAALHEAHVGLQIRLSCNLITEAFMEAREHCGRVAPAQRQAHTRALVRALASWAAQQQEMSGVIKLPFSPQEEQVLCTWLEEAMARGEATALYLPLLFLVRGRLTEALAAHARLLRSGVPSRLQGTPLLPPLHIPCKAAQGLATLSRLLASAAQLLPPAQRALHIAEANVGGAPGLLLCVGAAGEVLDEAADGRGAALPIVTGLPDMEVWAASQPALLASGGCLYGNLLAQRGGEQGESEAVGTRAAPQAQAQGGPEGATDGSRPSSAAGQAGQQDWATWRARDRGQDQERPTFGHLPGNSGHLPGNSGRADEGAEAEDDGWETVLGGPKKRGVARSTKRARMAPVRRKD